MTEQYVKLPVPGEDLLVEKLPPVFRVQSIVRLPFDGLHRLNRATLFHESVSLSVEWLSLKVDVDLRAGSLASIRWLGRPASLGGAIRIARLVRLERPVPELDLFKTVPWTWVGANDRPLLARASRLIDVLPPPMKALLTTVLWDGARFQRFLTGPSSLRGHHAERCGNLRHSIEVAEQAQAAALALPPASEGLSVLAAFLHDAGKADEYRISRHGRSLSTRGQLIGHRTTVVEWLACARAQCPVPVPEVWYLALIHALTCASGVPAWLGIRPPQSIDATIVSQADRLSSRRDLIDRHAPAEEGFGRFHAHLGARPFVIRTQTYR